MHIQLVSVSTSLLLIAFIASGCALKDTEHDIDSNAITSTKVVPYWAVPNADLEATGCGGPIEAAEHIACRAKRWCQSKRFATGFQSEWNADSTGAIFCIADAQSFDVLNSELESQGCGGAQDNPSHLACRAHRWCVAKGLSTGFQTEWGSDYGGVVYCLKDVPAAYPSRANLDAGGCGGNAGPKFYACRARRWCAAQGSLTGLQTEWNSDGGGAVYCLGKGETVDNNDRKDMPDDLPTKAKIYFGVYTGGADSGLPGDDQISLEQFEKDIGKGASMLGWVTWWYTFSWGGFDTLIKKWADKTLQHGSIPLVLWQMYNPMRDDGTLIKATDKDAIEHYKKFSLKRISAGDFDGYIRTWAKEIKTWGKPIILRPMHEMNTVATLGSCWGNPAFPETFAAVLYDTDCTTLINEPIDAINAWKHLVDIFRQEGANNVTWLWSVLSWPSVAYGGNNPTALKAIYPGDEYVDWIGIECYNFSGTWTQCSDAGIENAYQEASALSASKPMMIAEMGSKEKDDDQSAKATWIRNALSVNNPDSIPNKYSRIKAIFWWNDSRRDQGGGGALTVESSPQSIAAFKEVMASPIYAANSFSQMTISPIPPL